MVIEALMEITFGIDTMRAMEDAVQGRHSAFGIRHPEPAREEGADAYWSHVLVDWLGLHEGYTGPVADGPEEAVLLDRANAFIHRYWNLLENEWGDFVSGLIWALEPRLSRPEEEWKGARR
jgi:hypothetical protein